MSMEEDLREWIKPMGAFFVFYMEIVGDSRQPQMHDVINTYS
jgi:hypothetical protein